MTDPTADAIAALTSAESLADSEGFEDSAAYFREVRSALLSAQGQAGKPVAESDAALLAEISDILKYPEQITYDSADALRNSRDRIVVLLADLTTARTALEAAEKAIRTAQTVATDLLRLSMREEFTEAHIAETMERVGQSGGTPAYVADLNETVRVVLSIVSSALATIKGLET